MLSPEIEEWLTGLFDLQDGALTNSGGIRFSAHPHVRSLKCRVSVSASLFLEHAFLRHLFLSDLFERNFIDLTSQVINKSYCSVDRHEKWHDALSPISTFDPHLSLYMDELRVRTTRFSSTILGPGTERNYNQLDGYWTFQVLFYSWNLFLLWMNFL